MHPLDENHIHPGLLGEPVPQYLPLLLRLGESEVKFPHQLWDELAEFHHGDVAPNAHAGPGAELAGVSM